MGQMLESNHHLLTYLVKNLRNVLLAMSTKVKS